MNYLTRWQRPLTTWPNFGRLTNLREELIRLFEAPLTELARTSQLLNHGAPAIDLYEGNDNFLVRAELAGMKKEDIEISFQDGSLSISGERKAEKHEGTELRRSERFFGRFERTISFSAPVAGDKVTANYKDGVLTVTLPKTEEAKPKQIDVQVN